MSAYLHALLTVIIVTLVTQLTRWLPFLAFRNSGKLPSVIEYLGKTLPAAIMAVLVVYCLKDISFGSIAAFAPQLISAAVVAALHIWKRNTLLSIGAGTVCYMILIRIIV